MSRPLHAVVRRHLPGLPRSLSAIATARRSRVAGAFAARMCSPASLRSLSESASQAAATFSFFERILSSSGGADTSAIWSSRAMRSPTLKLAALQKGAVNSTNQSSVPLPQALIVRRPKGTPFAVPSITVVPVRPHGRTCRPGITTYTGRLGSLRWSRVESCTTGLGLMTPNAPNEPRAAAT